MRLVLIITTVVLLLSCAGFFTYEFISFRQSSKERLATLAEVIAANSTATLKFDDSKNATEILYALSAEKHITAAAIYDKNGSLFARFPADVPKYNLPFNPGKDGFDYVNDHLQGFSPIMQDKNRLGTVYLQSDMRAIYQRFERYGLIAFLVFAVSVLVAYILSRKLQKKISEPILALAETVGTISGHHDYTVRAKKYNDDDEMGVLTNAFNRMLSEIERQNLEITSFNHELELKVKERTNELEKANVELKLKSDFEETIIKSSVEVIAVFDQEYRYVTLNKYGKKVFGVEGKEVIGKNILELFPQIRSSFMYLHLQQAFKTGEIILDKNYRSYVSDRVFENFFIPLFDQKGIVYQVLVIGHDITEISKTHEKLKELNNELEKSNLDLEQFAFVASHDLQEPLRKIRTFSQLLQKKIDDKDAIKFYSSKIITSAERMTDLIKAVLNYSRLSSAKGEFEEVDLNQVIENIKTDLELTIAEKEASFKVDTLPVIYGNTLQLNQLFQNLISNSLKFSKRKPEILISSAITDKIPNKTSETFHRNESFVELIFKDNGIGFDQQYADKIFNVFQRLHSKQEYPGTGIGLALCKKIVENHFGAIRVASIPEEGTEFVISLPMGTHSIERANMTAARARLEQQ